MVCPHVIIMFLMFIVFFLLVNMNFQTSLLVDFFNSMRGQYTYSVLSVITIAIVIRYSIGWYFGPMKLGNMEMWWMVSKQQTIFSICLFAVLC